MNATHLFAGVCLVAGLAVAQTTQPVSTLPRGPIDLAENPAPVNAIGWHWWGFASANERMPADSQKGYGPTASTVHATYIDTDASGFVPRIEYRRSLDGGLTWEKEQVIHTLSAGEKLSSASSSRILCEGHQVAILFRSDVMTPTGGVAVIGYSSNDQGQTWNGPTLLTPAFAGANPTIEHDGGSPSGSEFVATFSGGKIHVHYEGVYVTNPKTTNAEECFYCRASIDAQGKLVLEKADVPVSNFSKPNEFDIDNVEMAADGKLVVLLYQNQTTLGNNYNNTFVRISRDGGDSWDPAYAITNFDTTSHPTHPSTDGNSDVAVSGKAIVVITEDNRDQGAHGRFDEVFADVSYDEGKTWQKTVLVSTTAANNDIDDNTIAANGGTFVISWFEDLGKGNADNQHFVMAGTAVEIAMGTAKVVNLSALTNTKDCNDVENAVVSGDGQFIVVAGEDAAGNSGTLAWSCDRGQTWMAEKYTDGNQDVDDPKCGLTLNGDLLTVYAEDFLGGNNGNKMLVTGTKIPMLKNMIAQNSGLELHCGARSAGQGALVLINEKGPAKGYPLFADGSSFYFEIDPLTQVGLSFGPVFLALVDNSGVAKFPAIPDVKKYTGKAWYALALTFDITKGVWVEFTDALKND